MCGCRACASCVRRVLQSGRTGISFHSWFASCTQNTHTRAFSNSPQCQKHKSVFHLFEMHDSKSRPTWSLDLAVWQIRVRAVNMGRLKLESSGTEAVSTMTQQLYKLFFFLHEILFRIYNTSSPSLFLYLINPKSCISFIRFCCQIGFICLTSPYDLFSLYSLGISASFCHIFKNIFVFRRFSQDISLRDSFFFFFTYWMSFYSEKQVRFHVWTKTRSRDGGVHES